MRNYKVLLVHKYLAFVFSLPLLLLALSGCLIALTPHSEPAKAATSVPLDVLMDQVKSVYPDAIFMRGMTRGPGGQTAHLLTRLRHGPRMIWSSDSQLVVRDMTGDFFFQNKHFHESFLLHGPGKLVVAISGLGLALILFSGILYWLGPGLIKRTRHVWRNSPRRLMAWHVVAGFVLVLPLSFQTITGSLIELHPLVFKQTELLPHTRPESCSYAEQLAFIKMHPELSMVFFCRPDSPYFTLKIKNGPLTQMTPAGIAVARGEAVSRKGQFVGLHGAKFMGPIENFYNLLMGISLIFFILSGFILWARKKFRRS